MRRTGLAAGAALAVLACAVCAPVSAAPAGGETARPADELSGQQQRRARTRIEVRPQRMRAPLGPNDVRQCVAWLQPEYRPSGTVITPQMRCWWERG